MNPRALAAATPHTRDRYVDLLRVGSIAVVVIGHWLMAVPTTTPGKIVAGNALQSSPALQYLTWIFQVMPIFFVVGGFADFAALRNEPTYAEFVASRVRRLLAPTAVFVAVWVAVALATEATGRQRGMTELAAGSVAQPLWFLGVYLAVVGLAPAMLRWHWRHGVAVPVVLAAAAIGVDAARFGLGVPQFGLLNLALVWLAVHQLGYLYADGTLLRRGVAAAMAVGGLAAVVTLTGFGGYPVSMVGMPGEPVSNMNPPTVALLAHAIWLTGAVLLLRDRARRWLADRRVWTVVVAANGVVMTVFLWHLSALFGGYALALGLGVPLPAPATAAWWLTRPLWLSALTVPAATLVAVFRRAELPGARTGAQPNRTTERAATGDRQGERGGARPAGHRALAAAGVAVAALGILAVSVVGFAGLLAGHTVVLVVLPVNLPLAVGLVVAGAALTLAARARLPVPVARPAEGG